MKIHSDKYTKISMEMLYDNIEDLIKTALERKNEIAGDMLTQLLTDAKEIEKVLLEK